MRLPIWFVRASGFDAEAHRQSALAAASVYVVEDQAFVDAISWFGDAEVDVGAAMITPREL